MSSEHTIAGNQLILLQSGEEFFPALCADIAAAQHFVLLETYRFVADEMGILIAEALQHAAARGVTVRVLLDGFGSSELPEDWLDNWRMAGIEVQWFRREIARFSFRRHRFRRLHRKLVVVDGDVAYIGGINILNDVPANTGLTQPQLDYAVRVQGSAVGTIYQAIRHLWGVVSWANFHRRDTLKPQLFAGDRAETLALTFVVRDNLRHRRDIERAYLRAIAAARDEIIIANAYFLPGRVFRRSLKQATKRGVRVVLLLQGQAEYIIQHYATHYLYGELLAAGVEIYEYQASYLHAKVAVIDAQWATVGSSNIDPFSLLLAREANLLVDDAGFAQALRTSLLTAIGNDAKRVELAQDKFLTSFFAQLSYGIIRFLLEIVGYSRRHR